MFILLRRIERWLHQHIFKVGWLMTRNFQTTTILYYTFFLPGVFLQQLTYWLAGGALNVRGKVEIPFFKRDQPDNRQNKDKAAENPPQKTIDISKLKPNFVTLDFSGGRKRNAPKGTYRKAIISVVPLLVALVCIWLIATRIFNIMDVVSTMSTGNLPDIAEGFGLLTGSPNFWLWIYIVFTIANTMFPPVPDELRGWRIIIVSLVAVGLALTLIGVGGEIFDALQTPLSTLVSVMQVMLILIICIDILMVLVLGLIEYTIEHMTGHTATFRGSTMEVMTREEAVIAKEQELEKQRRQEERLLRQRNKAADSELKSIYMLAFPIPGAPNEVGVTPLIDEQADAIPEPEQPSLFPAATTSPHGISDDLAARIHLPERKPLVPSQPETEPDTTEADESSIPAASVTEDAISVPIRKPISLVPDADDKTGNDLEDEAFPVRKPVALTPPSSFARPKSTSNEDDIDTDQADEASEVDSPKSVAPFSSRFGATSFRGISPKIDEEQDDELEERLKPAASLTSRFGMTPKKSKSTDKDESDEKLAPAKPKGLLSRPSDNKQELDEDERIKPAIPLSSRFGTTPFRGLSSPDDNQDESENDEKNSSIAGLSPAKPKGLLSPKPSDKKESKSRFSRSTSSPFSRRFQSQDDDDEDYDDDDESLLRRGRGDGAVSDLFGGLSLHQSKDDDSDDKPIDRSQRFGSLGRSPSRFGSQRSVIGSSNVDDDEYEYEDYDDVYEDYDDDDEYVSYDDDD
ncbi:MAG: hypothetical protein Q9P01_07035 [Anaerolineae bacterium]|nr:hypothetical protein [Anaerolineae bacterium]MDQ7034581.1 hypothetical protein [Anaerolineae bacterium]